MTDLHLQGEIIFLFIAVVLTPTLIVITAVAAVIIEITIMITCSFGCSFLMILVGVVAGHLFCIVLTFTCQGGSCDISFCLTGFRSR